MSVADNIFKDLGFKSNEIELYKQIRLEVFLKDSSDSNSKLVSKIVKMIDKEYSQNDI